MRAVFCLAVFCGGCAGVEPVAADLSPLSEGTGAWNADFAATADTTHDVVLDCLGGETDVALDFEVLGQDRHRVAFEVRGMQQLVHFEVDAWNLEIHYHGKNPSDAPYVQMRLAETLDHDGGVDVLLDPGVYSFDFHSWQADADAVTPVSIQASSDVGSFTPEFRSARRLRVGDTVEGNLMFGERDLYVVEGSGQLGMEALALESSRVCMRTWIGEDQRVLRQDRASSAETFSRTVFSGQELLVELIGCHPGEARDYAHQVVGGPID